MDKVKNVWMEEWMDRSSDGQKNVGTEEQTYGVTLSLLVLLHRRKKSEQWIQMKNATKTDFVKNN